MDWKGINQVVGQDATPDLIFLLFKDYWIHPVDFAFFLIWTESFFLFFEKGRTCFKKMISESVKEVGSLLFCPIQYILAEKSSAPSYFDDIKILLAYDFCHL